MEDLLQNIILSRNPCPICIDAANQEPMSYSSWADSEWGLPGTDARYCSDDCHCVLVPVDALDALPEISDLVRLRGEEGTEIPSVIDISPSEQGLKEVMEEWNAKYGKLPPEIYDMDVFEVEPYLRKLIKKLEGGR